MPQHLLQSHQLSVKFLNECQERGLDFKMSVDDYFKLSKRVLEVGCSVGELIARKLDTLSKEP
jgi:glutamate mutase epsilon subunit